MHRMKSHWKNNWKCNLIRIIYLVVRTMRKNQLKNQVSDINPNCLENHVNSDICIFEDTWSIYQTIFGDHVRYHQYDVNEYISFIRTDHWNDTYVFSMSVNSFQNWDMICMRIDSSNDHRWADAYFQLYHLMMLFASRLKYDRIRTRRHYDLLSCIALWWQINDESYVFICLAIMSS